MIDQALLRLLISGFLRERLLLLPSAEVCPVIRNGELESRHRPERTPSFQPIGFRFYNSIRAAV